MNIRKEVFKLLEENALLSTKHICKILQLCYEKRRGLIYRYRYQWRSSLQKQAGSKVKVDFHRARGWVYVKALGLSVVDAVQRGWEQTKAKNHYLQFKSRGYGSMKWFPTTGRVNLSVDKPATKGRAYQLFCNGFSMNGLIDSMTVLQKILESIRFKAAHAVFHLRERVPYLQVNMFKMSNGMIIKLGDKSHPDALEVEFCYPDFAEKSEAALERNKKALEENAEFFKQIRDLFTEKKPDRLGEDDKDKPFYVS